MRQKQDNTKDVREEQEHLSDFMGDIGNFDLPDLDLNLVDFLPSDETEETRYTLPKVVPMKEDFVMYDNAQKMAKELRLGWGTLRCIRERFLHIRGLHRGVPNNPASLRQENDDKHAFA